LGWVKSREKGERRKEDLELLQPLDERESKNSKL